MAKVFGIGVVGLAAIFAFHFIIPSWLNGFPHGLNFDLFTLWDNETADFVLKSRLNDSEFGRRPLMLYSQLLLEHYAGIPAQASFNLLSFAVWAIMICLLMLITNRICPTGNTLWAIVAFLLSFPIVFMYAANICTYDDSLQFMLLAATLLAVIHHRWLLALVLSFLACLARETSVLLIPFFAYWYFHQTRSSWLTIIWLLPIIAWLTFILVFLPHHLWLGTVSHTVEHRFFAYQFNFGTWRETSDTLVSTYLVLAIPLLFYWQLLRKIALSEKQRILLYGSLGVALINTPLVWTAAIAHEARLFLLPLLLFWPLVPALQPLYPARAIRPKATDIPAIILIFFLAAYLAFYAYRPCVGGTGWLFRCYALPYSVFFGWLVYTSSFSRSHAR